jgi:hypothetical protein
MQRQKLQEANRSELLLLRDLLDRGAAGLGIEQHGLVGREHLLHAGDVRQLSGGAAVVESAEMLVAGQALAHFQDFNVTVLQLPNLSFGQNQGSAFAIQFHIYGLRVATPANRRG